MRIPGIIHRSRLSSVGISDADRRRLLRQGQIRRVGTWYVTSEAPAELLPILELGLRPTCLTAAAHHGLWIPLHSGTHVYRPRDARVAGSVAGLVPHGSGLRCWPDNDPVAELSLVLEHAARCLPIPEAAILFESALYRHNLSMHAIQECLSRLPRHLRTPLGRVSPLAESGTETAVRWWLESLTVSAAPQVRIEGVGRVDLLVGRSWIIECDSVQYHDTTAQFHRDRDRDLRLRSLGYVVTRLTWEQVFLQWPVTRDHLLTVLRRRDHRRAPSR